VQSPAHQGRLDDGLSRQRAVELRAREAFDSRCESAVRRLEILRLDAADPLRCTRHRHAFAREQKLPGKRRTVQLASRHRHTAALSRRFA
jgi:hypothetical protein